MSDDPRVLAAELLAASPLAMTMQEAQEHIRARRAQLLAQSAQSSPKKSEPDFTTPEPLPVLDQPEQFASDFWTKRRLPRPDDEPPKPKPKKPRGRRPIGDLKPAHDRFRVVDGDKKE